MKVTSCTGPTCGRPYQINQFSDSAISAEPGKITCPHCGAVTAGEANAVFMTHALSAAEEAEFTNSGNISDEVEGGGSGNGGDAAPAIGEPPQE
jgi:hypothetical protein